MSWYQRYEQTAPRVVPATRGQLVITDVEPEILGRNLWQKFSDTQDDGLIPKLCLIYEQTIVAVQHGRRSALMKCLNPEAGMLVGMLCTLYDLTLAHGSELLSRADAIAAPKKPEKILDKLPDKSVMSTSVEIHRRKNTKEKKYKCEHLTSSYVNFVFSESFKFIKRLVC